MTPLAKVPISMSLAVGGLVILLTLLLPIPPEEIVAQGVSCDIYTTDERTVTECLKKYGWTSVNVLSSSELQFYVRRANNTTWNSSGKCTDVVDAITNLLGGGTDDVITEGTHSADVGWHLVLPRQDSGEVHGLVIEENQTDDERWTTFIHEAAHHADIPGPTPISRTVSFWL